jgi:hypothetical protein
MFGQHGSPRGRWWIDEEKSTKDRQHAEDGVEAVPRRGSSRLGNGQLRMTGTGRGTDSKSRGYSLMVCARESQMPTMAGSGWKYIAC